LFLSLTHAGETYTNFPPEDLLAAGIPQAVIDDALTAVLVNAAARELDEICDTLFTHSTSRGERYARKYEEAKLYRDADYPANVSPADYPFLVAEAAAMGITKRVQADSVIAAGMAFAQIGAAAEATRAALAPAIGAASGLPAKEAVAAGIINQFKAGVASASQEA
jgi:hypothetical protein